MIFLGKIVNTHGLKGEVRIVSDFKYKNDVFKKGALFYVSSDRLIVDSYRVHKNYDMVKFVGIDNIDNVLKYKGKNVFIKKEDYEFSGILNEDLIGLSVYSNDKLIGKVTNVFKNVNQDLIEVDGHILIPYVPAFVKEISDFKIIIDEIEGLIE